METERYLEKDILTQEDIEIYKDKKLIYSGPVESVKVRLGSWYRGDHISEWFDEIAQVCDYTTEYYITEEMLEEFLDICKKIETNPKKAKKLLPSYSDEDYAAIVSTKEILEEALKDGSADFRYIITKW